MSERFISLQHLILEVSGFLVAARITRRELAGPLTVSLSLSQAQ